ncbi:MAG: hypothetical protein AB7O24_19995 [Kofleriaceae bacterium]
MRRVSWFVLALLAACSKPEDSSKQPASSAPPPQVKKPVDRTPLPPLAADPGGATGKPIWAVGFGGLGIDSPRGIAAGPDGESYVVGTFDGEIDFGGTIGKRKAAGFAASPKPEKPDDTGKCKTNCSDAYVVKISNDGKLAWAHTFGDLRDDVANAVAVRGDRAVVVGSFLDKLTLGDFTKKSFGSDDAFVAAFDRGGEAKWIWNFGGVDSDGANAIAATPDGGWIVGGSFSDVAEFGKTPLKSKGGTDAMLLKLASTGDIEWVKQFGGTRDDTILGIVVDAQGSVYIQGQFQNVSNWGGTEPLKAAGGSDTDIVLAKYDLNGDHVWSKGFGNSFNDAAGGLAIDPSGHVTMVGAIDKTVSFGPGDSHEGVEGDIFVARFAPSGKLEWAKTFGAEREDIGYGVASDSAGNTLVTGWFRGTVDFSKAKLTAKDTHNKDVFVMKLDKTGNVVWVQRAGDRDHDQGRAIAVDPSGAALITGIFRFSFDLVEPPLESKHTDGDRVPKPDTFVLKLER